MFHRKRIYLYAGFLDGFGLRSQVQHALTDSAGHVETVDDVLVVVLALAVGAGIHLLFGGVIVDAGSRTSGCAGAQARDARRHGHERDKVAADDWQLRDRLFSSVNSVRLSAVSTIGASVLTVTDSAGRPDLERNREH